MALDPTNACFNDLPSGQQAAAFYGVLVDILQTLDPMADPVLADYAANPCFNVLTSGQQLSAIWSALEAIALVSGGDGTVYYGNGSPNGVVTAGTGATYWQLDAPGVVWGKMTAVGNTGWVANA